MEILILIKVVMFSLGMHALATSEQIPQAEFAVKVHAERSVKVFTYELDRASVDKIHQIASRERESRLCNVSDIGNCMLATLDNSEKDVMRKLINRIQYDIDNYKGAIGHSYNPKNVGFIHKSYALETSKEWAWIARHTE